MDPAKPSLSRTPRVAFFCPLWSRPGPMRLGWSDYWRLALPAAELHRNGWDVVLGRNVGPGEEGRLSVQDPDGRWWGDRDVLVFSRWMSKDAPRLIRTARDAGQVLINDLDDYFWDLPEGHPAIIATDPETQPDYNRTNYAATFSESSRVTTSTAWLAGRVADEIAPGIPVSVVSNYIDLRAWPTRAPGTLVGWVGATAGRAGDLEVLRAIVPWLKEHDETFYHGGAIPGEPAMKDVLSYDKILVRRNQSPQNYPRLWDPMRIALIPLGTEPFSRAKSWCKALEACARGIPFIASNHSEYQELGVGRLAATPDEWMWQLEALQDPVVYATDAIVNRKRAEQLAMETNWSTWASVIQGTHIEEKEIVV